MIVGAGYDMRPFRLDLPAGTRVFELDFPTVLIDRQRRLDVFSIKDRAGVLRMPVPLDLRTATVSATLAKRTSMPRLPCLSRGKA